jgi:hypothetical protein
MFVRMHGTKPKFVDGIGAVIVGHKLMAREKKNVKKKNRGDFGAISALISSVLISAALIEN